MQETLVTFETAKLAKEKGFKNPIALCYADGDKEARPFDAGSQLYYNDLEYYSAPTQNLLQRWLREHHNIWVLISFGYKVEWEVFKVDKDKENIWNMDKNEPTLNDGLCDTYEDALEQGLQEALKLIK